MGSSVEGTPEQVNGVAEEEQEEEQEEDSDEEEEEEDEEEGEEEDDDDSAEYETDSGSGSEYETDSDDEEEDESGDGGGGRGAGAVTLPGSPGGTVGSKSVCTDLLLLHSLYFSLLLTCLVCVHVWVWVYLRRVSSGLGVERVRPPAFLAPPLAQLQGRPPHLLQNPAQVRRRRRC